MLGNLAASHAAKIAALCVCPVGAAVVVTQVPQVRSAVHRMTAPPRHVPARRLAPRAVPAASVPVQTAMAATPCPSGAPVLTQGGEAVALATPAFSGAPLSQPFPFVSFGGSSSSSGGGQPGPFPPAPGVEPNSSPLPEPGTWVQFGLGFAILGGAIRSAGSSRKSNAAQDLKAS